MRLTGNVIKKKLLVFFIFLMIINFLFSVFITAFGLLNGNYLDDFQEIDNLVGRKEKMEVLLLDITKGDEYRAGGDSPPVYMIEGFLVNDNSRIEVMARREEFVNWELQFQPLYRSKLTNKYYLKDAPDAYYDLELASLYIMVYFKVSFYLLLLLFIYVIRVKIK
ncbi:MAG: hypothetical protein OIF50_08940 [Flavobacteriaceae bacterium]|nr:hypothetical protein [Flavobacteriaceae bacterium]